MKLKYITAFTAKAVKWAKQEQDWNDFALDLKQNVRIVNCKQSEYHNLDKTRQSILKDGACFVPATLRNIVSGRKIGNIQERTMICLDSDNSDQDFIRNVKKALPFTAMAIYETLSSTANDLRYRVVIPLQNSVEADKFPLISMLVADAIDRERKGTGTQVKGVRSIRESYFDPSTHEVNRLMYLPSRFKDSNIYTEIVEGVQFNPETYCYQRDITDIREYLEREGLLITEKLKNKDGRVSELGDPSQKGGYIGAFCTKYSIQDAISEFLPDIYSTDDGYRYTYNGGTTANGAIVYDDGMYLYSNHGTDPAFQQCCNAFDLVRIHRYGNFDKNIDTSTPSEQLPSYIKMLGFLKKNKEMNAAVRAEMHGKEVDKFKTEFVDKNKDNEKPIDFDNFVDTNWINDLEPLAKGAGFKASAKNFDLILANDPYLKNKLRYNEFDNFNYLSLPRKWDTGTKVVECEPRTEIDFDRDAFIRYCELNYGIDKQPAKAVAAFRSAFEKQSYHPVKELIESAKWDGESRVDSLFSTYLGAEDTAYNRKVARIQLVASVKRIYEPGCKYDTVPVLVGAQGGGKSTFISKLYGDWVLDSVASVLHKDALEQIHSGAWGVEVAELAALKKVEVESVKHFFSKTRDDFRPSYGRVVERRDRRCVFWGTTNKADFLSDATGNRRFLPVTVGTSEHNPMAGKLDVWNDLSPDVVAQIWAEAYVMYQQGEEVIMKGEILKAAEAVQNEHKDVDPITSQIAEFLEQPIPENYYQMTMPQRREFYNQTLRKGMSDTPAMPTGADDPFGGGVDFGALMPRTKVCYHELMIECLDEKDVKNKGMKYRVEEAMREIGGWQWQPNSVRFGIHNKQKYFKKI